MTFDVIRTITVRRSLTQTDDAGVNVRALRPSLALASCSLAHHAAPVQLHATAGPVPARAWSASAVTWRPPARPARQTRRAQTIRPSARSA